MAHNRRAKNFAHLFVPNTQQPSPGTPSTAPEPSKIEPQVFYRTLTELEHDSSKQDFFIPARP
eukprot:12681089-Alexandrium_andersonii.AAC.1